MSRWLGRITGAGAVMAVSLLATVVMATAIGLTGQRVEPTLQQRYEMLPALPTTAASNVEVAPTAIALASQLGAVPTDPAGTPCQTDRLRVRWEEPEGYRVGALVEPLGPPPGGNATAANGVVVCEGSTYAFMGFEANRRSDGSWLVTAVPAFAEDALAEVTDDIDLRYLAELRYLDGDPLTLGDIGPVDPYASYQPQRLCAPDPKPGMVAMARLLTEQYPATGSFGISRSCDVGARSEHKEGRAFDWAARITDTEQRAAVEDLLSRLLATDAAGNRHALARRMGVMYLIWNEHIWSSYRAEDGWRPYGGPSAHTDHVHVSLSWDGAMGQTSLWQVRLDGLGLDQLALPGALVPGEVQAVPDDALARTDPPYVLTIGDEGSQSDGTAGGQGEDGSGSDDPSGEDGGVVADLEDGVYLLADLLEQDPVGTVTDTVEDTTGDLGEVAEDTSGEVGDTVDDVTGDGDGGSGGADLTDELDDTVSDLATDEPLAP